MLKVTFIAETDALAGMPETVRLLVAPAKELSGTGTFIGPVVKFAEDVVDEELVNLTAG